MNTWIRLMNEDNEIIFIVYDKVLNNFITIELTPELELFWIRQRKYIWKYVYKKISEWFEKTDMSSEKADNIKNIMNEFYGIRIS